jgi:hypothetical protein
VSLTLLTAVATAVASLPLSDAAAAEQLQCETELDFAFTPAVGDDLIALGALADETADPIDSTGDAIAPAFGTADTWRFYVHGGGGVHVKTSDNAFGLAGVGFERFVAEGLSLNFEFNGMYVSQEGDDAWGANVNLLLRWHFICEDTWSAYLDGGAGLLGTTDDVPDNGSSFNFTPQAGAGLTFDIGKNNRLMTGVRWQHISNANLYEDNPGRDSVMVYIGISMPF